MRRKRGKNVSWAVRATSPADVYLNVALGLVGSHRPPRRITRKTATSSGNKGGPRTPKPRVERLPERTKAWPPRHTQKEAGHTGFLWKTGQPEDGKAAEESPESRGLRRQSSISQVNQ
uniref:Uncharacterized protein n=1 Tax=Trypanosoma congolense (strain IL3000) TaxID=1068625 RepID=G0USQ2_TRYCI|nr:hypothetical protein, unlikely [Trypanosoma congolense IL3000]